MNSAIRIPLVVAFVVGITATGFSAPESGTVTVAVGDVTVVPRGGQAAVLKPGEKVAVGSTVKTGDDSRAVIVMTPRSVIRVGPNSEVVVSLVNEEARPRNVLVDVRSGTLAALLKPDAAKDLDFKIQTPSGVAAARGTYYAVTVEDGIGYAKVKRGVVQLIPGKAAAKP